MNSWCIEDLCILGYDNVLLGEWFPVFWRIVISFCWVKQSKKNRRLFAILLGLPDPCWPFKTKALCYLTHRNRSPSDTVSLSPQQHHCANLQSWLLYCLEGLTNDIKCQWDVVSDEVMLTLSWLCVNTDAGNCNIPIYVIISHSPGTIILHFGWRLVCIWGDKWPGCGHVRAPSACGWISWWWMNERNPSFQCDKVLEPLDTLSIVRDARWVLLRKEWFNIL